MTFKEELRRLEFDLVLKYLELTWGNVAEAGKLAGVKRNYFRNLVDRHGIDPNVFKKDRTSN